MLVVLEAGKVTGRGLGLARWVQPRRQDYLRVAPPRGESTAGTAGKLTPQLVCDIVVGTKKPSVSVSYGHSDAV